jgi:hypothetical protein
MSYKKYNKYNACKRYTADGLKFDSSKEYRRYLYLKDRLRNGEISNLRTQVKYLLIPEQREPSFTTKTGKVKQGKLIERECSYIADFVYFDNEQQEEIVEDVKGYRKSMGYNYYVIKRKLMLYVHGIKITEI